MRRRKDRMAGLGELQLQVLEKLSELGEANVYQVQEAFEEGERPRYTTLATVLRSLEKKGLAEHRTEDRTYIYRAACEVSEVRRSIVSEILGRAFGGSPAAMVSALLDVDSVTDRELDEVRRMIEERTKGEGADS